MRRFTIFASVKRQKGCDCTHELLADTMHKPELLELCEKIAAEPDADRRGYLKKGLPIVTWQAAFDGKRLASEAIPSGLFMLDIDHIEDPYALYKEKVASRIKELGILFVHKTPSTKGLRIVAKCPKGLNTIEEAQRWLASNLKVEFDGVCKDFARSSFLVHDSYIYYANYKELWADPEDGEVYSLNGAYKPNVEMEKMLESPSQDSVTLPLVFPDKKEGTVDQREGLFGGATEYKGIPLEEIAVEWLKNTGGEPEQGERNARLYKLATRMRYITDFNEATLLRVMPRYGLDEEEMKSLIRSACQSNRAGDIPYDLRDTLEKLDKRIKLGNNEDEDLEGLPEIITDATTLPPLPPLFKEWAEVAPDDFKAASILCQLPILGALGSRLRAVYLDGKVHSPSFQVSLEAPQASGKSFLVGLVNRELAPMMQADEAAREEERAYQEKVAEMKMLNIKINADNKDQILGTKPKAIIRYLPATISITMLLKRMYNAGGLHCFALAEEIDTVAKAYKRGYSNLSEMLRVSFDNGLYGQDYASENSWSGNIQLFYNTLFSGTPKAMRRFYPDVEDGLVSRVLFVTIPDQFGKPMPIWGKFSPEQERIVDVNLEKLNEISVQGSDVQPEHMMKLNFLNKAFGEWVRKQQLAAVEQDDRTRDVFCRRAAVVGFRAGMLAWFLYNEKGTPTIRKNVVKFAIWVANKMLNQHLLRFKVEGTGSNVNRWEDVLKELPEKFNRQQVQDALARHNVDTELKQVLYKWKLANLIEEVSKGATDRGRRAGITFKKINQ